MKITRTVSHGAARRALLRALLFCLLLPAAAASAQENPFSTHNKYIFGHMKTILLRSAEKMPEEHYGFRPTEEVRSYGQIIGHVADSQYVFCSRVRGEKNPGLDIEKTKTSKAELVAALKDAFAYCEAAYNGLTDATGAETLKLFRTDTPRLGVLAVNQAHTMEHYGNLVTYMRMKNIVPPTSEPGFLPEPKK